MNRLLLVSIAIVMFCIGIWTVYGEEITPNLTITPEVTTDYNSGSIDLVKGWNFISVPRRLGDSGNTASIFNGIDSAFKQSKRPSTLIALNNITYGIIISLNLLFTLFVPIVSV